ncbi:MAG: WG repeat-containing protein [Flavobacterium sp.]|nr:WG repeat-containing protein [Flavobacterium sp.]
MNWQNIKVSVDNTHFLHNENPIFGRHFIEVLKFHSPGIAPVKDDSGSYHIDSWGKQLNADRYLRAFGFYCNRAAVIQAENWFHITVTGERAYNQSFNWSGNFQENLCTVRNKDNEYFHINPNGERVYKNNYIYCGDFKDGYACVKTIDGLYQHIDTEGNFLNNKKFLDLGVFHKNFATAKDKNGWYHIEKSGNEIYQHRFLAAEPFYNGFALVTQFDNNKIIIDEQGQKIITV